MSIAKQIILIIVLTLLITLIPKQKTMPAENFKYSIDLQDGFQAKYVNKAPGERVTLTVDGKIIYDEITRSNPMISLATDINDLTSEKKDLVLNVKLPERNIDQTFNVDLSKGAYLGITTKYPGNEGDEVVILKQQDHSFGYD